jgi:recombination associated protein RdgC
MFLKNAMVYGFEGVESDALFQMVQKHRFVPCSEMAELSTGWGPFAKTNEQVYAVDNCYFLSFVIEKKSVPGSAVKAKLEARLKEIEDAQGFAPGKKQTAELRQRVRDELLPRAIPVRRHITVMIDMGAKRVVIDTPSTTTAETVAVALFKQESIELTATPGLGRLLNEVVLAEFLNTFTVDDHALLQLAGQKKTEVKYSRADLGDAVLHNYIAAGATVLDLGMTYESRLSFKIDSQGHIRGIKTLDLLREQVREAKEFDASCRLGIDYLRGLLGAVANLKNILSEEA